MSLNISAKDIKPLRLNYSHIIRRIGDKKPASRYQEAVLDVQPTTNFHYPPSWEPDKQLFDVTRTKIVMEDWYSFTDPRQYYYTSYVSARAKQQEVMDKNFDVLEKHSMLKNVDTATLNAVRSLLIPLRHYEYGANMNNQDICDRGYGAAITSAASYQGFDHIGMAQYISRIALLLDDNEDTTLVAAKTQWMDNPEWQPLRKALEDSFVCDDWFEILVAQNLILDAYIYPLAYEHFMGKVSAEGGTSLIMLTQFFNDWYKESCRWTDQLIKVTAKESDHNKALIEQWVIKWSDVAQQSATALSDIYLKDNAATALESMQTALSTRLKKSGLTL